MAAQGLVLSRIHQAVVEPGRTPGTQGPLDSRGVPETGAGVGAVPKLTAHTRPSPRTKASTPGGVSSQRSVPSPNWGSAARSWRPSRYRCQKERVSARARSVAYSAKYSGCGSQGLAL